MPPADAVQTEGHGVDVLFIHGTAADRSSWRGLTTLLRGRIRATTYDRRGAASWPIVDGEAPPLVSDHAADAADLIGALGSPSVHVCATSFGAVVALELLKRRPDLVRSAVLFEPALSGDDLVPQVPRTLSDAVERAFALGEPERAAEYFHRRMLGDATWRRMPDVVRREMMRRATQIRHDLVANAAYRVHYDELGRIHVPVLLLQGGRSRTVFAQALRALQAALPGSQRQLIEGAAHMPSGDAWREFADALTAFIGA